jgi:uridine monophosphate synthetase
MNFVDKLTQAISRNQSLLCIGLDPNPELLPVISGSMLEAFQSWLYQEIQETQNDVCAYKLTLGFYLSLGAEGLTLLQQVLDWIPSFIPVILDTKHGDLSSSTVLANAAFSQWQVDAITLNPYAGQEQIAPFLVYPGKMVFVLCRSHSSTATRIQHYPHDQNPLYLHVVREARTWGTPEQLGLEVGSLDTDILQQIRALAPERWILARNLWLRDQDIIKAALAVGLDQAGTGMIIPVSTELRARQRGSEAVNSLSQLRQEVNQVRETLLNTGSTCPLWTANVCLLSRDPHLELILRLYDLGCILFGGDYVQASGTVLPYYIDLRMIISNPQVFQQILTAYTTILKTLTFDRIAGIPYGSLPTATGLALHLNCPMIYPRKETKAHGTKKCIEGFFRPGETVVVVDDILISGKSAIEGAEKLQSAGLVVKDIVVLIDHEHGVKERLQQAGYRGYSVLTISQIMQTLYETGRITQAQYDLVV